MSRLTVVHPALPGDLVVGPGELRVLTAPEAGPVVAVLRGRAPRGARLAVDGRWVRRRGLAARVRRGIAVVAGAPVAADVSVGDHLAAIVGTAAARGLLAGAPLLADRGPDPAGVLSGGERRVLAWLRARAVDPRVVLLDRAGEGLDAATMAWAGDVVAAWLADGVAVVVRPGRVEEQEWADLTAPARPSPPRR